VSSSAARRVACVLQIPGDCIQDGALEISDSICLLGCLFSGVPETLPCGNGTSGHFANTTLLDSSGDSSLDLSDAVYRLGFLVLGMPPSVLGAECVAIADCPVTCGSLANDAR
jgi:hypothetical protein